MHAILSREPIEAALKSLGFECIKHEEGGSDTWLFDDPREIQGYIFKCRAGWYTVEMDSYQSSVDCTTVFDGDISLPEELAEFKEWMTKQVKHSPHY